jgi:hypothetical protein
VLKADKYVAVPTERTGVTPPARGPNIININFKDEPANICKDIEMYRLAYR